MLACVNYLDLYSCKLTENEPPEQQREYYHSVFLQQRNGISRIHPRIILYLSFTIGSMQNNKSNFL